MPPLAPVHSAPKIRTRSRPHNPHKPVESLEGSDTYAKFYASPCSLLLGTKIAPNHPGKRACLESLEGSEASLAFDHIRDTRLNPCVLGPDIPVAWAPPD